MAAQSATPLLKVEGLKQYFKEMCIRDRLWIATPSPATS